MIHTCITRMRLKLLPSKYKLNGRQQGVGRCLTQARACLNLWYRSQLMVVFVGVRSIVLRAVVGVLVLMPMP
jgi:hypothetical protein